MTCLSYMPVNHGLTRNRAVSSGWRSNTLGVVLTILHVQGSEYAFGARNYTIADLDRALSKLPFGWVLSPFVHGTL